MKIYDFTQAPNPRRLRIFVAEKGLKIPYEQVDIFSAKNRTPAMLARNPAGGLPVLELDDGSCIAESVAIARFLEALHPEPNLFGRDAREQAEIEMWSRRMELGLFGLLGRAFQNTSPLFASAVVRRPHQVVPRLWSSAARDGKATARLARFATQGQGIHRRCALYDCRHSCARRDHLWHAVSGPEARPGAQGTRAMAHGGLLAAERGSLRSSLRLREGTARGIRCVGRLSPHGRLEARRTRRADASAAPALLRASLHCGQAPAVRRR